MHLQVGTPVSRIEWRTSGEPVDYTVAVEEMERRVAAIRSGAAPELVWLLTHPALYTAGTSARDNELLEPGRLPVYRSGRGGRYTYHGPGQRIAYVMLDLRRRGQDVRCFVHQLEEWIIGVLACFGIRGERRDGRVGIWVGRGRGREDKVAAIGVRVRQWVTYHGLAFNIDPELDHYRGIVPCGIAEHGVTSLAELGVDATVEEVDRVLHETFGTIFADPFSCRLPGVQA